MKDLDLQTLRQLRALELAGTLDRLSEQIDRLDPSERKATAEIVCDALTAPHYLKYAERFDPAERAAVKRFLDKHMVQH